MVRKSDSDLQPGSCGADSMDCSLFELIRQYLNDFQPRSAERINLSGADVLLGEAAATIFPIIVHELFSNATTGVFASPNGGVQISGERSGSEYVLTWRETGWAQRGGHPDARARIDIVRKAIEQLGAVAELDVTQGRITAELRTKLVNERSL